MRLSEATGVVTNYIKDNPFNPLPLIVVAFTANSQMNLLGNFRANTRSDPNRVIKDQTGFCGNLKNVFAAKGVVEYHALIKCSMTIQPTEEEAAKLAVTGYSVIDSAEEILMVLSINKDEKFCTIFNIINENQFEERLTIAAQTGESLSGLFLELLPEEGATVSELLKDNLDMYIRTIEYTPLAAPIEESFESLFA